MYLEDGKNRRTSFGGARITRYVVSITLLGLFSLLMLVVSAAREPAVAAAQGSGYWPQVSPVLVADGLDYPVHVTHAGDGSGRLFVVEKAGKIRIIENGTLLGTPFLDITSQVGSAGHEQGLLSVAFPPDYETSGEFYVDYTDTNGDTVVARYSVSAGDPDQADSTSEDIILTIDQPDANHNGGQLAFGPSDGYLYIGTGDGGGSGDPDDNAQDGSSLLGKILRVDVATNTYAIPPTNPYLSSNDPSDDVRDEIWALGLRNPWRFSFDRQTHDLFIGDVGQNAWEEVDFQPASSAGGENYGWRCYEGTHEYNTTGCADPSNYVFPIHEYSHSDGHSVTGGFVYRGAEYPHMWGVYLYADYANGRIWGLKRNGSGWNNQLLHDADFSISSFGEDEAGELYITKYAGSPNGAVYKLTDTEMTLCDADYDNSTEIDVGDLIALRPLWGAEDGVDSSYDALKDLIYDGVIRVDDFIWLARQFGTSCP